MKALVMKYDSDKKTNKLICEENCMYYSTALDVVKNDILKDLKCRLTEVKIKKEIFTSDSSIKGFVESLNIFKMLDTYNKLKATIDAVITLSVTNKQGKLLGEYYIICSKESFKYSVINYLGAK